MVSTASYPPVREFFAHSGHHFFLEMDPKGDLLYANPCFTHKTGKLTSRTLLGKPFSGTALPEEVHLVEQGLNKLRQTPDRTIPLFIHTPTNDGKILCVQWELSSIVAEDKALSGIQCVGHSVPCPDARPENPHQESRLYEKLLHGLLDSRPEAALIVDTDHRIVVMNDQARQHISRFAGRELSPGFSLYSTLESPVKEIYETLNYHVQVNGAFSKDLILPGIGGTPLWVHVRAYPISSQEAPAGHTLITLELANEKAENPAPVLVREAFLQPSVPDTADFRKPVTQILGLIAALDMDHPGDPMNLPVLRKLDQLAHQLDQLLHQA